MISLFLIHAVVGQCTTYKYRKSVFDMTAVEVQRWQNGHLQLYSKGKLQEMTRIHGTYQTIHKDAHLWAWHREFLNWYEEELLQIDPNVILPYFPWIYDADAPELSDVWNDNIIGGSQVVWDGQTYQAQCIPSGPFKNLMDNEGKCVSRQFDRTGKTGFPQDLLYKIGQTPTSQSNIKIQLYGENSYNQWLNTADPNYFVSLLSTPHFLIHLFVGGSQNWFKSSCFDGLFWLHHGFMDFILDDWLKMHPDQIQNWPESNWKLDHFQITTGEVLRKDYCVRYIRPLKKGSGHIPTETSAPVSQSTDLDDSDQYSNDRIIPRIPEQPIIEMGMNPAYIKKSYEENQKIIVITDIKQKYSKGSTTPQSKSIPGLDTIIDGIVAALKINISSNDLALIKSVTKGMSNFGSINSVIQEFVKSLKYGQSGAYQSDAQEQDGTAPSQFNSTKKDALQYRTSNAASTSICCAVLTSMASYIIL